MPQAEQETGAPIVAADIAVGDVIQHHMRRWPPARVVRVVQSPYIAGTLQRVEMVYPSGRTATLVGVPGDARFLRLAGGAL